MRGLLITMAAVFLMATTMPAPAHAATTNAPSITVSAPVYALQVPDKTIDINVNTHSGGGVRWYRNPVWIAIAAIGGVVLLLLLVLVARGGGGTTIVKD